MKIKVVASGSKGNLTLIENNKLKILIDAGISLKKLEERLKEKIDNIDIIIITHTHDDHIKGLNSYIKKFNPLIITQSEELATLNINNAQEYEKNDIKIKLFNLSHDVKCSGVSIKGTKELVYITDTGYINSKVLDIIKNKDMYIMESNHDINLLRNSKYPFYLKQRILGDRGHLSNEDCSKYIEKIIGENTKNIVLAHLSEENNNKELAYDKTYEKIKNKDIKLEVAMQDEALDWIEI